jgi:hypothetical protein
MEDIMGLLEALGISIGVLAGILCMITSALGLEGVPVFLQLAPWPGFVAWACYFAVGGKKEGLGKVVVANAVGAIWAVIIILLLVPLSFLNAVPIPGFALGIAVIIGAFFLCVEAHWTPLSFIPGAFCGCACAFGFGVGTDVQKLIAVILSMWLGAIFAILSDVWGNKIAKKTS